jgi:hypothetical protein
VLDAQAGEQIEDLGGAARVDVAGGLVGESSAGVLMSALAMATRCFSPPDS